MTAGPPWLGADPIAEQLLEQGVDVDQVAEVLERAAIIEEGDRLDRDFAAVAALISLAPILRVQKSPSPTRGKS